MSKQMDFKYKRIAKTIKYEDNVHSTKCHIINIHYIRRKDMAHSHRAVCFGRACGSDKYIRNEDSIYKLTYDNYSVAPRS